MEILHLIIYLFLPLVRCLKLEYDFIIVGGGTAGCAVARRLAESGKFSVLVIETGGLPKNGSDVPALAATFLDDQDVMYHYQSVPQKNAGLRNGGVIGVLAGKMLGGGSSMNYMFFNRGSPHDYDNWANQTLDNNWNYANMLKYFKKSETYAGNFLSNQHGVKGPITVSQPRYAPGLRHWLDAGRWLGYPVADPNGPQQISFTPVESSQSRGRRVSSWVGYLKPILNSLPKLTIMTNTNATQIVFQGNRAIGVRISSSVLELQNLPDNCIYAKKEIIISAGSLGSPVLLQRSGIGPRKVLQDAGINVLEDLPVGLNLNNHPTIPLYYSINDTSVILDEERDLTPENWDYYNRVGDGPYSSSGAAGASGQAFIASSVVTPTWADLQLVMSHSTTPYVGIVQDVETLSATLKPWEALVSASVWLMRSKSKGSVTINPSNVYGSPLIDLGYFNHPDDITAMIDGIRVAMQVFETTPQYISLGAQYRRVPLPSCDVHKFRSLSYWECYVKHMSIGACHPAGTNAMGSVVNTKLKVFGIQNLRVIDASIMPDITNANLQASVYGIAEKGSELILNEHF